ncbi:hypothetical protein JCM5350_000249, partial [Sporobolomyces pararoseus]
MGANGSTPGNRSGGLIDHYTVLGIERTASSIEIKKAFRSLALKEHPDKNPQDVEGANLRFSRIQEAYEVLSDPQEKAWYDDHLEQLLNGPIGGAESSTSFEEDLNYFDQLRKGKRKTKAQQEQEHSGEKRSRPDRGLQVPHLMRFFNTNTWSGYDDSPQGFFETFDTLFSLISS